MLQGVQKNLHAICASSQNYPYQVCIWCTFTSNIKYGESICDYEDLMFLWQCFFPQYALPYIRTPYFIL